MKTYQYQHVVALAEKIRDRIKEFFDGEIAAAKQRSDTALGRVREAAVDLAEASVRDAGTSKLENKWDELLGQWNPFVSGSGVVRRGVDQPNVVQYLERKKEMAEASMEVRSLERSYYRTWEIAQREVGLFINEHDKAEQSDSQVAEVLANRKREEQAQSGLATPHPANFGQPGVGKTVVCDTYDPYSSPTEVERFIQHDLPTDLSICTEKFSKAFVKKVNRLMDKFGTASIARHPTWKAWCKDNGDAFDAIQLRLARPEVEAFMNELPPDLAKLSYTRQQAFLRRASRLHGKYGGGTVAHHPKWMAWFRVNGEVFGKARLDHGKVLAKNAGRK